MSKKMTIEDLAGVVESLAEAVREGFVKADEKIDNLAMMTQRGFLDAEKNLNEFKHEVNRRFDHLEEIILEEHRQRIENLEDRVKALESDFRSLVGKK